MVTTVQSVQTFDLQNYMDRLKRAKSQTEIENIQAELDAASTLHIQNIQGDNYEADALDFLKQIEKAVDNLE